MTRSTALRFSRDMQTIIRLAATLTNELVSTAHALVATNYNATQAADLLGIEATVVRKRISRLRERLTAAMGRYEPRNIKSVERHLLFQADDRAYRWAAAKEEKEDELE